MNAHSTHTQCPKCIVIDICGGRRVEQLQLNLQQSYASCEHSANKLYKFHLGEKEKEAKFFTIKRLQQNALS